MTMINKTKFVVTAAMLKARASSQAHWNHTLLVEMRGLRYSGSVATFTFVNSIRFDVQTLTQALRAIIT